MESKLISSGASTRVKTKKIISTIVKAGHPVTGEKATFTVTGMTDEAGAKDLREQLVFHVGVDRVVATPGEHGRVMVIFDPNLTDRSKVEAAIGETKYKLVKQD